MSDTDYNSPLYRKTTEIARRYGCDRGVFSVCWGELEEGLPCRCKQEAKQELDALTPTNPGAR